MNEFIHKMLKVSRAMTRRKSIITLFNYPSGQKKKKRGGITSLVIIFVITIVILIISVEKTLLVVFHNRRFHNFQRFHFIISPKVHLKKKRLELSKE